MDRVVEILDAYGSRSAQWPEEERPALEAFFAASLEARALRARAEHLDAALDAATLEAPSSELMDRILAAAPRAIESGRSDATADRAATQAAATHTGARIATARRAGGRRAGGMRVWRTAALASLAAAAGLALWIARDVTSEQAVPARDTEVVALDADEIAALGVFTVPTDALLDSPGYDLADAMPTLGCEEGELGCPDFSSGDLADPSSQSQRTQSRRVQA